VRESRAVLELSERMAMPEPEKAREVPIRGDELTPVLER
jgi:hypothetical protein